MDENLKTALIKWGTDIEGAMHRFAGNENLYENCLCSFIKDTTMQEFENAIKIESWDEAFTAVHALKGIAGNMGFVPLFHNAAEMVIIIRNGRISEVGKSYSDLKLNYINLVDILKAYLNLEV